ncbi:transglycosylase domain-containing protein [Gloeobacter kilaueensis]|uniref:Penicillin-binding protein, 1A family n=1 Tax=Gloeobacter kilaueensis (strain ATCC BAA-2537 / CCAP 1431/1 / ULC 316 / JS1) TaxID=1183438 RepID=U5QKJ7_GLOK1|nr:PBP1A family penicillin-binding protein [Gloeobacter kilaueensis]AGY59378.1 penicillin-binding protein, 1A family [Gloeobacter kilaueensis JS1]
MAFPDSSLAGVRSAASAGAFLRSHRRQILLGFLLTLLASLLGLVVALFWDLPSADAVRHYTPENQLLIKAMDGSLLYNSAQGPAKQVTYKQIPDSLIKAIVATEDRRFYDHQGIDWRGIGRAIVRDVQARSLREGGSTITQQLARNLFLNQQRTLWRKLKEIVIAARIEQELSKEEILTLYLNQIYFGSGAYGVADAARTYFSKPIERLSLTESALLAGLPQAPSRYSPLINKSLARKRRDAVLKNMVEVGYLPRPGYEQARKRPVVIRPSERPQLLQAGYFSAYIQSLLPDLLDTQTVPGGLTVETTLDPKMQAAAQRTLTTALASYRARRVSQGALVTLDPASGEIRAMVGGGDFQKSQFNRAVQALRQPGSTFKVFVYTAAIENGIRPEDVYVDRPLRFGRYTVKNYDRRYYGPMTLVDALKESRNTIAVQLFNKVGEAKVVDVARRMGIHSKLQSGAAMALGASDVSLLELTSAYGTLASGGRYSEPVAVRRIVDKDGRLLYSAARQSRPALSPEVTSTMTRMLQQVIENGTGRRADIGRPAAGKTGTTENYRDLLFVGYTPQLVTGVWLGNDDNQPTRGSSGLAAALWGRYMGQALASYPEVDFPDIGDNEPLPASPPQGEEEPAAEPDSNQPDEQPRSDDTDCERDEQGQLVCSNAAGTAAQEPSSPAAAPQNGQNGDNQGSAPPPDNPLPSPELDHEHALPASPAPTDTPQQP